MSRTSPGRRVAVIGLGTMGSMALWQLAAAGARADGFEQYGVGHDFGAAGGGTRMFRLVYAEGVRYLPLLLRSRLLWSRLEAGWGQDILVRNGCLTIADAASPQITRSEAMASQGRLAYEIMSPATVAALYPQHELADSEVALFDPEGGVLRTEHAVLAALAEAARLGATIRANCAVTSVEPDDEGVTIIVDGSPRRYDEVVLATGPWSNQILQDWGYAPVTRRVRTSFHLPRSPRLSDPRHFPAALRRLADGRSYGLMSALDGNTVKFVIATEEDSRPVPVAEVFGEPVSPAFLAAVTDLVATAMPLVHPYPVRVSQHPEGFTRDGEAMVGRVPGVPHVVLMSGFSGHGFKLAPAFGEAAAALALGQASALPAFLDPARFAPGALSVADSGLADLWFDGNNASN